MHGRSWLYWKAIKDEVIGGQKRQATCDSFCHVNIFWMSFIDNVESQLPTAATSIDLQKIIATAHNLDPNFPFRYRFNSVLSPFERKKFQQKLILGQPQG
jgi:hypothetical protein